MYVLFICMADFLFIFEVLVDGMMQILSTLVEKAAVVTNHWSTVLVKQIQSISLNLSCGVLWGRHLLLLLIFET